MDYVLGEVLYAGLETHVLAGRHPVTGARVAVKLPSEHRLAARVADQLRHEHAMLCELATLGGVRALELLPYGQGVALVMERWGEGSLERALSRGPLPVEAALRLGAALARALGKVHRRGVIHRDIKPQNVLVDAALREVRIIDYGIAIRRPIYVDDNAAAETLAGTLGYMAPEQTGRMRRAVDARADLYGLGVTLWQMLTGALPFEMEDRMELIHAHIARTPAPPHERAPAQRIPPAVSAIVMKLLEKSPERRYQTAEGVAFDLERAARALAETGTVAPLALASRDWEDRIRKPSRLFGRERELAALEAAWAEVSGGAAGLALIAGPSGVGKSALVEALRDRVRERGGLFASGKFDQLRRGAAHEALSQGLRSVVRRRLADPAEELARWTASWQAAAGPNARILVDFVPELRHLAGELPEVPELSSADAKNRFHRTVQRFVRGAATAERPLLLFIDDIQWAEASSLELLREIVTDPDVRYLLVVCAYRSDEMDAQLLGALTAARAQRGRDALTIALAPLAEGALDAMIGDMLGQPATETRALSALVKAKTDGSPFFVEQFLRALHERRLLVRDLETGRWSWDAGAIEHAGVTDNLVALLTGKIQRLAAISRRVLSLGACVGPSFEAALVRAAGALDRAALLQALDDLQREGLVSAAADEGERYAFVHDRVQQAAYEALDDARERAEAHLAFARELHRRGDWEAREDELFTMLGHFVRALPRMEGSEERAEVAALLLRGAKRAKASVAYAQAATFLRAGSALLGDSGPEQATDLAFRMQLALGEIEWLTGRPELGEALLRDARDRATDPMQRKRAAIPWIPLLHDDGRHQEAVEMSLRLLADMGLEPPEDGEGIRAVVLEIIPRIAPKIASLSAEGWQALPRCTDPVQLDLAEMLDVATSGVLFVPRLIPWLAFIAVDHALEHGVAPWSTSALGKVGFLAITQFHRFDLGARCMEIVFGLGHLPGASVPWFSACTASQYVYRLDRVLERWREMSALCERDGSYVQEELALSLLARIQCLRGAPLGSWILPKRRWRTSFSRDIMAITQGCFDVLSGAVPHRRKEAIAWLAGIASATPSNRFGAAATAAYVAMHLGEDSEAKRLAIEAEPLLAAALGSPAEILLLQVLTVLGATAAPGDGDEAAALRARLPVHRARLERHAAMSPATFRHMHLLAEAGDARASGRYGAAERLYLDAIADAHHQGFLNDEALGLRLLGEHYLARGEHCPARAYLREAHEAYLRWGADRAASSLRERHPDFFPTERAAVASDAGPRSTITRTASETTGAESALDAHLDAASVLRATQALSGDMVLGSLLERMLRVLAQNAGAERVALALVVRGELRVRAALSVEPERLAVDLDEPARGSPRLPATLVDYVARSKEPVVLGQATSDTRFEHDAYLRTHRPASVLAMPLLHRGRLSGVIYLEHPRAADAFSPARAQMVVLLASQAATAVENAALYAELQASNERLEREVAERTAELRRAKEAADAANKAKSDFLASMSHELRTPLNAILGYAQILGQASALSPRDLDGVRVIRKAGEHLLTLINDVLDLAKIEAGKVDLVRRDVHLPTLLRTLTGMCRVRAEQKGIAFVCDPRSLDLPTVVCDERRLMQVLLNLLGNAIKFTEQGSVRLSAEAVRDRDAAMCTVRFRVADTGPGIPPGEIARIFEPFEQAGEMNARAEGTGLGLAITQRLVDSMGGQIEVESAVGRGSVFTVTLPVQLALSAVNAAPEALSWEQITGYLGPRRTLLVVDDHADNRAVLRDLLSPVGFEILEADSGERALALAAACRPALVLLDLSMPGMDGHETIRRLRSDPELASAPILATSANASAAAARAPDRSGWDDFLPKPVRAEELFAMLERHLGLSWARREVAPASRPAALRRPPEEVLTALRELASRGRIQQLLEEVQRLEGLDPELGPWLTQLRAVAQGFQVRSVQQFLGEELGGRGASHEA